MNRSPFPTRRDVLRTAGLAAAALPLASIAPDARAAGEGPNLVGPVTAPSTQPADPWRGLKVGVASYSFRKLPLEATIKGIVRVGLQYVSIKDAPSAAEEHGRAAEGGGRRSSRTPASRR